MASVTINQNREIAALICINDVSDADGGLSLPLTPCYGQPFIHHVIKLLENKGISRFFIGVDSVPSALLSYGDDIKKTGLDVTFARDPQMVAAQVDADTDILVFCADTVWDADHVSKAIAENRVLIATVEEREENQYFERIDLNNRWAGVARLHRSTLEALTQLPEGWDMASALLRQGLQDGVQLWPIKQARVEAGCIRKIRNAADLNAAMTILTPTPKAGPKTIDAAAFSPLIKHVLPSIWTTGGARETAEWAFPLLAVFALVFAGAKIPVAAFFCAVLALFASHLRRQILVVEYRDNGNDAITVTGWALLSIALILLLYNIEMSVVQSGFLGVVVVALSRFSERYLGSGQFWVSSPLVVAMTLLFGILTHSSSWIIKALVVVQLGWLLFEQSRLTPKSEK
jgi:hypothetical protein